MEDAKFRATRLRSLLPRLQDRLTAVGNHEEYLQWREKFDPLKAKVDAAAAKLKQVYTKATAELVPLFREIEKLDLEVAAVSQAKPYHTRQSNNDNCHLRSVELTARGLNGFGTSFGFGTDHKIMDIKLPHWQHPTELLWPPNRQLDYSHVVPVVKHPGADWWKTQEQDHGDKAATAERLNVEQQQAEAAKRETRFHNLDDWGMKVE